MTDEAPEWTIEVNLPNLPEGTPVQVYGLGEFKNGDTYGVDDELVHLYRLNHCLRDTNRDIVKGQKDPMVLISHQEGILLYPTAGGKPPEKQEEASDEEVRVGSESEGGAA